MRSILLLLLGVPIPIIILIALCINFIGDGLRDALDPRMAKRL